MLSINFKSSFILFSKFGGNQPGFPGWLLLLYYKITLVVVPGVLVSVTRAM